MDVAAFAKGYLSLIQSNDRGKGVTVAADFLQPTVDLTQMLGLNNRRIVETIAALTTGFAVFFEVPQGEVWIVRGGGATVLVPIGEQIQGMTLIVQPPESPNTQRFPASLSVSEPVDTVAKTTTVLWDPLGILLGPGTVCGMDITFAPVPLNINYSLYYDLLRV
jgi:hypothetical protein